MAFGTRSRASTWPLARAVRVLTTLVVGVIVVGIALVLLGANRSNMLVDNILDVGRWLTTPFDNLFPQANVKQDVLVNWGIGAVVYFLAGGLLSRVIR